MPAHAPDPGQKWSDGSTGQMFTVVAVTRQRVILTGDDGAYREVPLYAWPQGLVLVPDASLEDGSPQRIEALLVGGDEGRHLARIRDLASDLGVDITMHVPGRIASAPRVIPRGIELVIFLTSHIDHSKYYAMKSLCVSSGTPFVSVRSDGFRVDLASELKRIGAKLLSGSRFGAVSSGWWSWREQGWVFVEVDPSPQHQPGADNLIAVLLSFLPVLALR